jgi:small subunit ribosomal protein S8
MVVDPIADMCTRIRNAQAVEKEVVSIPFSQVKYQIAKVLEKSKYLEGIEVKGRKTKRFIELKLSYESNMNPKITGIKRISKPGMRSYSASQRLPRVLGGRGISIISTSSGIMTDTNAKKKNIGGEILCQVW